MHSNRSAMGDVFKAILRVRDGGRSKDGLLLSKAEDGWVALPASIYPLQVGACGKRPPIIAPHEGAAVAAAELPTDPPRPPHRMAPPAVERGGVRHAPPPGALRELPPVAGRRPTKDFPESRCDVFRARRETRAKGGDRPFAPRQGAGERRRGRRRRPLLRPPDLPDARRGGARLQEAPWTSEGKGGGGVGTSSPIATSDPGRKAALVGPPDASRLAVRGRSVRALSRGECKIGRTSCGLRVHLVGSNRWPRLNR